MNDLGAQPPLLPPTRCPSIGLAIASLVLGILAIVLSPVLIGILLGVIGLILGMIHLRNQQAGKGMARWGSSLSVLGIAAGVALGVFYYKSYEAFTAISEAVGTEEVDDIDQWQGTLAPDFEVATLDGQKLQLSALRGKRVVLDFWATWCPPCVDEIPHFIRLFKETSRENLMIVGISSEASETLKPFLRKHGVNYPIASSVETNLPAPYSNIRSIPTTFFIDRNGIIQFIATGYHDFESIKAKALAEDSQESPKPPVQTRASEFELPLPPSGTTATLKTVWTVPIPAAQAVTVGDWEGDVAPEILVAARKKLHVLSVSGTSLRTLSLPASFTVIEAGRHATKGARLVGYDNWGKEAVAMNKEGEVIWSYATPQGIDGAHWGDLDGDGTDELIVGMNGSGGLHAISSEGKKLWSVTDIGNVWNQAVIPASKDRPALVFATEAGGTVQVYNAKGKRLRTIRPQGKYCAKMTAAVVDATGRIQAVASGEGRAIAFDDEGQVSWSTPVPKAPGRWRASTFSGGDLTGDGQSEWVFHERNGALAIVSVQGETLATVPAEAKLAAFVIVPSGKSDGLLITLADGSVRALTLAP